MVVLLNLLIKPVWLVLENNVQNQIGHAAFGTYIALFSFTFIFTSFTDLGIYHYFTKQTAATPEFMAQNLPAVFPFKVLISILFPLVILICGWAIGYNQTELYYLFFIGLIFTLTQFIQFLRGMLQAHQYFNLDSVMSVLERFILIFIVLFLLYTGLTLNAFVYARFTAVLLTLLVVFYVFRKKFGSLRLKWNSRQLVKILKASFPFAIINLVNGINEKIDMVMLERLASNQEAGLYAGAYRWVDAIMMYLWTILPIFFAKFAAHQHEPQEQQKILQFGQVVVSVPLLFISVFGFFYGDKLFWQFKNSSISELSLMHQNLQILFGYVLVNGLFAIYATILTASNREITASKLVAISIVVNVTLNYFLIPEYGSRAAAVNTLISGLVVSVGYLLLLKPQLGIPLPTSLILKIMLSTGVLVGVFYALRTWSDYWWLNSGLAGLAFVLILALLRVFDLAGLKNNIFNRTT